MRTLLISLFVPALALAAPPPKPVLARLARTLAATTRGKTKLRSDKLTKARNATLLASKAKKLAVKPAEEEKAPTPQDLIEVARKAVVSNIELHGNLSTKYAAPTTTGFLAPASDGHSLQPITGYGMVHVWVKQDLRTDATLLQRITHPFSRYTNRQFDVAVDEKGNAVVLNTGWSHTLTANVARWFRNGPSQMISSFLHDNPKSTELLTTGALTLASGISGLLSGATGIGAYLGGTGFVAGFGRTVAVYKEARADVIKKRDLRQKAFDSTVGWAQKLGASGKFPTLQQSYDHYTSMIKDQTVVPGFTLGGFAERLYAEGL